MLLQHDHINVHFTEDAKYVSVKGIYQFDYGIKLRMYGLDMTVMPSVHFASDKQAVAINATPEINAKDKYWEVEIPNELLMMPRACFGYVYIEDGDSGFVEYVMNIPVLPRSRPSSYVLKEEQRNGYNEILAAANDFVNSIKDSLSDQSTSLLDSATATVNDALAKMNDALNERLVEIDAISGKNIEAVNEMLAEIRADIEKLKKKYDRDMGAFGILNTAYGNNFTIEDSADYYVDGLSIYGYTEVDKDNKFHHITGDVNLVVGNTDICYTIDGVDLAGIPVLEGGNYTDEKEGFSWYCDDIDLFNGKYTQRVQEYRPTKWVKGENCWYTDIVQRDKINPLLYTKMYLNDNMDLLYEVDGDLADAISYLLNNNEELLATYKNGEIGEGDPSNSYDFSKGFVCNVARYVPGHCHCMEQDVVYTCPHHENRVILMTDSEEEPQDVVFLFALKTPVVYNVAPIISSGNDPLLYTRWYYNDPNLEYEVDDDKADKISYELSDDEYLTGTYADDLGHGIDPEDIRTLRYVTKVTNDTACGVSVRYYCDIKTYIDNKVCGCKKPYVDPKPEKPYDKTPLCCLSCTADSCGDCCSARCKEPVRNLVRFHTINDPWYLKPSIIRNPETGMIEGVRPFDWDVPAKP